MEEEQEEEKGGERRMGKRKEVGGEGVCQLAVSAVTKHLAYS